MSVGKAEVAASVRVTSGGLLAVGALVSGILLSTAVLVNASAHAGARARAARDRD